MDDAAALLAKFEPRELVSFNAPQQLFAARFSPCGKFLAAGGYDGVIRRWSSELKFPDPPALDAKGKPVVPKLDPPAELSPLTGHGGWAQGLAFHPQGEFLFTADSWGKLCAWRYADENPQPVWTLEQAHDGWIQMVAVSPDGKQVATAGIDRKVRVFDAARGEELLELDGHVDAVLAVIFHPAGKTLLSGDLRGVIKEWSLSDGAHQRDIDATALYQSRRLQDTGGVRSLAFDAEGKTLGVGGTQVETSGTVTGKPTMLLFDYASGKVQRTLVVGATTDVFVHDLHFHPEGFLIAVTSGTPGAGKLLCQRPQDDKPFFESTKVSNIHGLSVHPDGVRFAVTGTNKGSNGNGRRTNKDGEYEDNVSPVHLYDLGPARQS